MGLRFRKSVKILPGVRLNFGKQSASVSVGVPGFRKTFNTKGQVTTTVGIPGTGLYYVDTKKTGLQSQHPTRETRAVTEQVQEPLSEPIYTNHNALSIVESEPEICATESRQISAKQIKSIHKSADDSVDWTEVLCSPNPPDETYNKDMWRYYHSVAGSVLSGDIDTYLQVIYEVNPLDDLLDYGTGFEFGSDSPKEMHVEFNVNESALSEARNTMNAIEYHKLLRDFICSTAIRIARDIFALLPVRYTIVHAILDNQTVLSVQFDRPVLSTIRFGYIDPSDTVTRFKHHMDFQDNIGFSAIQRLGD